MAAYQEHEPEDEFARVFDRGLNCVIVITNQMRFKSRSGWVEKYIEPMSGEHVMLNVAKKGVPCLTGKSFERDEMVDPGKVNNLCKLLIDYTTYLQLEFLRGRSTFVICCKNGRSRSPTVILAFLILYRGFTPSAAETWLQCIFKAQRPALFRTSHSEFPNFSKFYNVINKLQEYRDAMDESVLCSRVRFVAKKYCESNPTVTLLGNNPHSDIGTGLIDTIRQAQKSFSMKSGPWHQPMPVAVEVAKGLPESSFFNANKIEELIASAEKARRVRKRKPPNKFTVDDPPSPAKKKKKVGEKKKTIEKKKTLEKKKKVARGKLVATKPHDSAGTWTEAEIATLAQLAQEEPRRRWEEITRILNRRHHSRSHGRSRGAVEQCWQAKKKTLEKKKKVAHDKLVATKPHDSAWAWTEAEIATLAQLAQEEPRRRWEEITRILNRRHHSRSHGRSQGAVTQRWHMFVAQKANTALAAWTEAEDADLAHLAQKLQRGITTWKHITSTLNARYHYRSHGRGKDCVRHRWYFIRDQRQYVNNVADTPLDKTKIRSETDMHLSKGDFQPCRGLLYPEEASGKHLHCQRPASVRLESGQPLCNEERCQPGYISRNGNSIKERPDIGRMIDLIVDAFQKSDKFCIVAVWEEDLQVEAGRKSLTGWGSSYYDCECDQLDCAVCENIIGREDSLVIAYAQNADALIAGCPFFSCEWLQVYQFCCHYMKERNFQLCKRIDGDDRRRPHERVVYDDSLLRDFVKYTQMGDHHRFVDKKTKAEIRSLDLRHRFVESEVLEKIGWSYDKNGLLIKTIADLPERPIAAEPQPLPEERRGRRRGDSISAMSAELDGRLGNEEKFSTDASNVTEDSLASVIEEKQLVGEQKVGNEGGRHGKQTNLLGKEIVDLSRLHQTIRAPTMDVNMGRESAIRLKECKTSLEYVICEVEELDWVTRVPHCTPDKHYYSSLRYFAKCLMSSRIVNRPKSQTMFAYKSLGKQWLDNYMDRIDASPDVLTTAAACQVVYYDGLRFRDELQSVASVLPALRQRTIDALEELQVKLGSLENWRLYQDEICKTGKSTTFANHAPRERFNVIYKQVKNFSIIYKRPLKRFVKRIKQFYLAAGKQPEFVPKYRTVWRDSLGLDVKDRPILKERPPVKRKERPVAKRPKRPRRPRGISTPAGVVYNGSLVVKGNKGFRKVKEEPIMPLERTGRGDGNDASTILSADLTGEGEAMWTCKHGCGTTLGYDALVEHEKICPGGSSYPSSDSEPEGMVDTPGSGLKRDAAQPDAIDNKEGRSPRPKDEGRFECNCQYNCGLSGSIEEILRHEEHCDLRVGGPSSGAEGE